MAIARKNSQTGKTTSSDREDIRTETWRTIRGILGPLDEIDPSPHKDSPDAAVDFRYSRPLLTGRAPAIESVAAIVVGPYRDQSLYKMRRREWILKGFALTLFYDHAFLVLTSEGPMPDYRKAIGELQKHILASGRPPGNLDIVYVPLAERHSSPTGDPSSDPITDEIAEKLKNAPLPRPLRDSS